MHFDMMKIVYTIVLTLSLLTVSSCGKVETFHSGETKIDGTAVRYLVSESDLSMKVTAEGATPDVTIYVKLKYVQSSAITETVVDSIITIPHENTISLSKGNAYTLFLEKGGESIGVGQFNL